MYINGHLATVGALAEQGVDLIDLHGQHAHQSLLKTAVQRSALDRFGGIDTAPLASVLDELRAAESSLAELGGDERARAREIDLLRHQVAEIDTAGIEDPNEDQRLDDEEPPCRRVRPSRRRWHHRRALTPTARPPKPSLPRCCARRRAPFTDLASRLQGLSAELADVASEARSRAESIDDDPARLEQLRERRAMLRELRRKYGESLDDVLAFQAASSERLAELVSFDERAAALDEQRSALLADLTRLRAEVLAARTEAAPRLAAAVEEHLVGLAMAGARLEVSVAGEAGDEVAFRLAANAGHDPQPLTRVASGGELARTMLALRLVLSAGPPTLVFDEVDAGIGGDVANTVGASLADLAATHQVLVVTHLAQVAAFADQHVAIMKRDVDGRTVSEATVLDDDARAPSCPGCCRVHRLGIGPSARRRTASGRRCRPPTFIVRFPWWANARRLAPRG